jgi:hypothetical protein
MKKKEFERLLAEMRELTPAQHKHLTKQLTQVSARQAALVMVERRPWKIRRFVRTAGVLIPSAGERPRACSATVATPARVPSTR